jgi:hypothetical protein
MSRLALKQGHFSIILMSTQGCSTRSGSARLAWQDEKMGVARQNVIRWGGIDSFSPKRELRVCL